MSSLRARSCTGEPAFKRCPSTPIYQLVAEEGSGAAAASQAIVLIPDLINLWLTGELANEATIASTTGLLEATGTGWARDLIARLGIPERPFAGNVVDPGRRLGSVLDGHGDPGGTPVYAVASHDTASAFVGTPLEGPTAAVLSSGTWSLFGLEVSEPVLGAEAAGFNLTNERGVDGTVRLLRNVMGLWLVQECRRAWSAAGLDLDYDDLHRVAREAAADVPLFDPDQPSLLRGGDMPNLIAAACTAAGQAAPAGPGGVLRSILLSLACKYRLVLEQLELVSGRRVEVVHVVGGGVRNALLCQLTADVLGLPGARGARGGDRRSATCSFRRAPAASCPRSRRSAGWWGARCGCSDTSRAAGARQTRLTNASFR